MDGHEYGLLLPNQYHFLLGTRNRCVEQIPAQHDVMLLQDGNNHDWELSTLTFVDTDTIRQVHIFHHVCGILDYFPIKELDFNYCIVFSPVSNRSDNSDLAIRDLFMIPILDHTIPLTENHATAFEFRFASILGIRDFPDLLIESIGTYSPFLTLGR